ncbi:MAG: hypothetical protein HY683_00705 [Chloroflexi bacterium]|nr:hypothetical protein [Chloroflexota bacterium]
MVSRPNLEIATLNYLRVVAKRLRTLSAEPPMLLGRYILPVESRLGPELAHPRLPEVAQLRELLIETGIPAERVPYGFLLPLVQGCLAAPYRFNRRRVRRATAFREFLSVALDGTVVARSQDLVVLDLACGPLELERGVMLRPMTASEHQDLCSSRVGAGGLFVAFGPFPWDQNVLNIAVEYSRRESGEVGDPGQSPRLLSERRLAVLASLVLVSAGRVDVEHLGAGNNYDLTHYAIARHFELRAFAGGNTRYVLTRKLAKRLKKAWPRLREILGSESHYLRLPALRLLDGASRDRADDAIVDYSIGLEALLTAGARDELSYRLALRGAHILTWDGGNRKQRFNELRDFYNVRSSIVHGSKIPQADLEGARSVGESALRAIWWWCFDQEADGLKRATQIVDERILS